MAAMNHSPVVIIGAGPAGLTAAHELVKHHVRPVVLEKDRQVGGLSRTETYLGYRFDIGGHRFFTEVEAVQRLWQELLGPDFPRVGRLSRIYFEGRFFKYPLDLTNVFFNLGFTESARILASYLLSRLRPCAEEDNFEQWVTNRFGRRLYERFFRTYTEKVWGLSCQRLRSDLARERIKGLSLTAAVSHALLGTGNAKTLINAFHYPVLGPGMMWQRFQERIEQGGGRLFLDREVVQIHREGDRVQAVTVRGGEGEEEVRADHYISSMPLSLLISRIRPQPPADVLEATRGLLYRDFILVGLITRRRDLFPDQWIYVHSPRVKVGRIQNFKNWSPRMTPDPQKTHLGMEYFCSRGGDIWTLPDAELIGLARRELVGLGLAEEAEIEDGVVFRQPRAYPVYDLGYQDRLGRIESYLAEIRNLQTIGRNGRHHYGNQDHSMLTGLVAARSLLGGR